MTEYTDGSPWHAVDPQDKIDALNDLIRELTRHADAMRDFIDALFARSHPGDDDGARALIDAYDGFIKEC